MNTKYKVEIAALEPYSFTENGEPLEYYAEDYEKLHFSLYDNKDDAILDVYSYYHANNLSVCDLSGVYNVEGRGDYVLYLSDKNTEDRLVSVRITKMLVD